MGYKCKGYVKNIKMGKGNKITFTIRASSTIEDPSSKKIFNVVIGLRGRSKLNGFKQEDPIKANPSFLGLLLAARVDQATFEVEKTASGWNLQSLEWGD